MFKLTHGLFCSLMMVDGEIKPKQIAAHICAVMSCSYLGHSRILPVQMGGCQASLHIRGPVAKSLCSRKRMAHGNLREKCLMEIF